MSSELQSGTAVNYLSVIYNLIIIFYFCIWWVLVFCLFLRQLVAAAQHAHLAAVSWPLSLVSTLEGLLRKLHSWIIIFLNKYCPRPSADSICRLKVGENRGDVRTHILLRTLFLLLQWFSVRKCWNLRQYCCTFSEQLATWEGLWIEQALSVCMSIGRWKLPA